MKQVLATIIRTLLSAAHGRAMLVLGKQAEVARPARLDYRRNAGGWN